MTDTERPKRLIRTERLTLRPFRIDDVDWIVPLANDFEISKWVAQLPYPYGRGDGFDFIRASAEKLASGTGIRFAIVGEAPMGAIGIDGLDSGAPELGYWLGRPFWGRGYAGEAAAAMVEYAFAELRLGEVRAGHFAENSSSARVLDRCGFSYTGETDKMACRARGVTMDCRRMTLKAEDWRRRHGQVR